MLEILGWGNMQELCRRDGGRENVSGLDTLRHRVGLFPFRDLQNVRLLIRNWQEVVLFRLGLRKRIIARLRAGGEYPINSMKDYNSFWDSLDTKLAYTRTFLAKKGASFVIKPRFVQIRLDAGQKLVFYYKGKKQLVSVLHLIGEQFGEGQYDGLRVKGRDVADIGASVGDTAIYFLTMGARHVYSYELYPETYRLAKKNIAANRLSGKVTLLNKGCGGKRSTVTVGNHGDTMTKSMKVSKTGKKVQIVTLKDAAEGLGRDSILKLDCEGCEYETVLNAPIEVLRKFSQIQLEYHYGYKDLESKLKAAGFAVRHTSPHFNANDDRVTGVIYGSRIGD